VFDPGFESDNERRSGQDRRQLKLDREKLIEAITTKQSKSKWQDIIKSGFIPVVIALASVLVTYQVNRQQLVSANIVAKSQLQSAEKIATANREHSSKIAKAELETQRLTQMAKVFDKIITLSVKGGREVQDELKQQVKSLSAYGDEALPFLVRLRDSKFDAKQGGTLSEAAKATIEEIFLLNQPIVEMKFIGKKDDLLYLSKRKYVNYNLSGSIFKDVTLYAADFSRSLLKKAEFIDADMRKVNFSNAALIDAQFTRTNIAEAIFDDANLENAIFEHVNLSKTNFEKANLKGAQFINCKNTGSARFSINYLLKANTEPFKSLAAREYTRLLMHREDELLTIHKDNERELENVYKKLNMANFNALQEKFNELRESADNKNSNNLLQYTAGLFP
jgi:uncharacterized protein YjbI with pentapeptide repeats